MEQQAKEARLNLQSETSGNTTPNQISVNVNDVAFGEKKEELKPEDKQNETNHKGKIKIWLVKLINFFRKSPSQ